MVAASSTRFALCALLFGGLVAFRSRTLFDRFSDPTIGWYLHIGTSWLNGFLPYTETWDYRPPGFFAMYALALRVIPPAFANQILALLALAGTALAVGGIATRLDRREGSASGWWAATLFVLLSPVNDGIAGAAELQISALIAGSIYCALRSRSSLAVVGAGLLSGLAIQCKLSAIPLVAVPAALVAMGAGQPLMNLAAYSCGLCLPVAIDVVVFGMAHDLNLLWDALVDASIRRGHTYSSGALFARNYGKLPAQLFALAPAIELAVLAYRPLNGRAKTASVAWLAAGLVSILVAGEYYDRQFVVLVAPAALLGGIGMETVLRKVTTRFRNRAAIALLFATFMLHDYHEVVIGTSAMAESLHSTHRDSDQFDVVKADVMAFPAGDRSLFLIQQNPYLYDALGLSAPTKFAYTDLLLDRRLASMAGIYGKMELRRVFRTKPILVVVSGLDDFRLDPPAVRVVERELAEHYRPVIRDLRFTIYERRSGE